MQRGSTFLFSQERDRNNGSESSITSQPRVGCFSYRPGYSGEAICEDLCASCHVQFLQGCSFILILNSAEESSKLRSNFGC